jgi:hypothetical protein
LNLTACSPFIFWRCEYFAYHGVSAVSQTWAPSVRASVRAVQAVVPAASFGALAVAELIPGRTTVSRSARECSSLPMQIHTQDRGTSILSVCQHRSLIDRSPIEHRIHQTSLVSIQIHIQDRGSPISSPWRLWWPSRRPHFLRCLPAWLLPIRIRIRDRESPISCPSRLQWSPSQPGHRCRCPAFAWPMHVHIQGRGTSISSLSQLRWSKDQSSVDRRVLSPVRPVLHMELAHVRHQEQTVLPPPRESCSQDIFLSTPQTHTCIQDKTSFPSFSQYSRRLLLASCASSAPFEKHPRHAHRGRELHLHQCRVALPSSILRTHSMLAPEAHRRNASR